MYPLLISSISVFLFTIINSSDSASWFLCMWSRSHIFVIHRCNSIKLLGTVHLTVYSKFCVGVIITWSQCTILGIWKICIATGGARYGGVILQIVYFGSSFGSAIAPIAANPFLSHHSRASNDTRCVIALMAKETYLLYTFRQEI